MPRNPSRFIYIDDFILAAGWFMRRLIEGNYGSWMNLNLWGSGDSASGNEVALPRDLSTFSNDLGIASGRAHEYLFALAFRQRERYDFENLDRFFIVLYSQNSVPFHEITRNWDLAGHYEEMDDVIVQTYFGDRAAGQRTVAGLSATLETVPLLTPDVYDVANWTDGYSGQMVFRGALTAPNAAEPTHQAVYNYSGELTGDNIISVDDIVTNTDFMSTSASPSAAAEFIIRQAVIVPGGANVPEVVVDALYRRVMFQIDMWSGRNITPWTELRQAEILFPLTSLFRVTSIRISDYGLIVELAEVPLDDQATITTAKNIITGAIVHLPRGN